MDRRSVAIAAVIVLVVVNLGLVAAVAYPLSEDDHRPAERAFEVGEEEPYRIVANITVDGETALAVDGTVAESGERYVRLTEGDRVHETYRDGGDREYARFVSDGDAADRLLKEYREGPEWEILREEREGGRVTVLAVTEDPSGKLDPTGGASVVANSMRLVAYDRVQKSGEEGLRVLEPQNGWYDGRESYRVTGASGEVVVDPETGVLHSADVEWDLTTGTDTYLHYLLRRQGTITQEVSYEYRTGDVSIERPGWVEEAADSYGPTSPGNETP